MTKELLLRALHGEQVVQTPWLPHIGTHAAQVKRQVSGREERVEESSVR